MRKRLKVSLCMITKDEEHCLLSCLNSVKHLVSEMIVVDTGSSDNTVHLSRLAGARVFNFKWTGDFSLARNFCLEQANGDWILVLDADEILAPVEAAEFYNLLHDQTVEGYFLHLNNYIGNGKQITRDKVLRLFRNKTEYRFAGAIHEQVAPSILKANGGNGLANAPLVINHYGYLDTVIKKKNKFKRNISIITRELKNNPQDPFLLYSLALEHYQIGQIDKGVDYLKRALALMKGSEGYFEDVILNTAIGLWQLGRWESLMDFVKKSLLMLPGQRDLLLIKGLANLALKRYPEAAGDMENSIKSGGSNLIPPFKVLSLIGDAYSLSGEYKKAETMYFLALYRNSNSLYPLTQILRLIQREHVHFDCTKLYGFCTVQKKDSLRRELVKANEYHLAMVVLLLEIYHLCTEKNTELPLPQITSDLLTLVKRLAPLCGNVLSLEYIFITTREIDTYALMIGKGYDSSHFMAWRRIGMLIADLLLFTIKRCCPRWDIHSFVPEEINNYP